MPYGIAKEAGGDSLENVAKVEAMVKAIMREDPNMDKVTAIKIAKSQLSKRKGRRRGH